MVAINFPSSPSVGDIHVVGDVTWRWNGASWSSSSTFNGRVPAGRTDQRPANPKIGTVRYNSDIDAFEGYDALGWRPFYGTIIITPVGVSPAAAVTLDNATTFTLVSDNEYFNLRGLAHASSDWQISDDPAFATTEVNISADAVNLTSYPVTGGISTGGTYYWRVRYRDSSGNESAYSTAIEFEVLPAPPLAFGDALCGGFYLGTICAASTCYYVIVAPNATGCACCAWKTTRTLTAAAASCVDGRANTYGPLDNATHPAGNWTATRSIGGFNDWYLPATDELNQLYVNKSSAPVGEGFTTLSADGYWSSTECSGSATFACFHRMRINTRSITIKEFLCRVRAVRREPV